MANFSQEILNFFEDLSTQPEVGGLQITNSSAQYVSFREGEENPVHYSLKIPPGVIERGRIHDEEKLVEVLKELQIKISRDDPSERVKVVVCLPSDIVFTQNFNIPNVGEKRLQESADLNIQMVSPIKEEDAYMSWQLISENKNQYGLLGAFANRHVVDQFKAALLAANFHPIAIEFPSLSLSWTVNKVIGPRDESMLILSVSSDGIDLFLLRNGYIYFDYFKSWKTVQGSSDQISQDKFNNSIVKEIRKVVNFSSSHFNESIKYSFIIAPGLEESIKNIVETNFNIQAHPLRGKFGDLGPAWYSVIGSAIRAGWKREEDRFISIGTEKVEDIFYKEQALDFIKRWRNIFAGTILVFIILLAGSAVLLRAQPQTIQDRLEEFNVSRQMTELNELQNEAERFNNMVSSIQQVRGDSLSIPEILTQVREISDSHNLTINEIGIGSSGNSISMSARAADSDTVIRFKNALEDSEDFNNVNLPFSNITSAEGGFVRFNISFSYSDTEGEE